MSFPRELWCATWSTRLEIAAVWLAVLETTLGDRSLGRPQHDVHPSAVGDKEDGAVECVCEWYVAAWNGGHHCCRRTGALVDVRNLREP